MKIEKMEKYNIANGLNGESEKILEEEIKSLLNNLK